MTILIALTVVIGVLFGYYVDAPILEAHTLLIEPILYGMVFMSGLLIGYDIKIRKTMKQIGIKMVTIPLFSAIGSILGGIGIGKFLGLSMGQAGAVASGMGWYSLSAVMIAQHDASLGALAFLCNIFRELLTFMFVPLVAKYIGYLEAIGPGGATTMDTTLPAIVKYTDENTMLVAFISGVILLGVVPVCVQFFIGITYGV